MRTRSLRGFPGGMALFLLLSPLQAEPAPVAREDHQIRQLQKERRNILAQAVEARKKQILAGQLGIEELCRAGRMLHQAELDLAVSKAERIRAHEQHFEFLQAMEKAMDLRFQTGQVSRADNLLMRAERLQAEIGLLKAGGTPREPPGTPSRARP